MKSILNFVNLINITIKQNKKMLKIDISKKNLEFCIFFTKLHLIKHFCKSNKKLSLTLTYFKNKPLLKKLKLPKSNIKKKIKNKSLFLLTNKGLIYGNDKIFLKKCYHVYYIVYI